MSPKVRLVLMQLVGTILVYQALNVVILVNLWDFDTLVGWGLRSGRLAMIGLSLFLCLRIGRGATPALRRSVRHTALILFTLAVGHLVIEAVTELPTLARDIEHLWGIAVTAQLTLFVLLLDFVTNVALISRRVTADGGPGY